MADILIVDDEPDTAKLFGMMLAETHWPLRFLTNPDDVLPAIRDQGIGVLLLDVLMPQRNGLDVLVDVRKLNPTICVVMMTGMDDMPTIRRAMNGGAYDFLTKPLDFGDVRTTIKRALEHHAYVQNLYDQRAAALRALQEAANITTTTLQILNAPAKRRTDRITIATDGRRPT